jgi:glycosyltransferase involved in cell wall biosynthesis
LVTLQSLASSITIFDLRAMSKRIILFGPLPPPYGGVSIYLEALAAHFRGANIRVWHYKGKATGAGMRYVAHRRLGTLSALLAEGYRSRILDTSHFHFEYPNALLLPLWLVAKRLLRFEWYKNVLDGSLPNRYAHFSRRQRWLFHRALRAVDQFVVVSPDLKQWLQQEMKTSQPITVVPCLVPIPTSEVNAPLSRDTEEQLAEYLSRQKRVCSIGVFVPAYGFQQIAEAVEELRQRTGKDIGLLLVDGGFALDEDYREQVLWERDWITVVEEIPNHEIYEILRRSDVFFRGVEIESYGISRVESLWCGTPVVATRTGEMRGMLLYDFGDVDQLVEQLQAVLLYPAIEDPNPWATQFRREAEEHLQVIASLLGIDFEEARRQVAAKRKR